MQSSNYEAGADSADFEKSYMRSILLLREKQRTNKQKIMLFLSLAYGTFWPFADMKKLQFDIVNIDIKRHHYNSSITKGGAVSKEKVLRLAQEQGR